MIQTLMASAEPKLFLWTTEQYHQFGELGIFNNQRVELIEGQVLHMSPMNDPHIIGLVFLSNELPQLANGRYTVLVQTSLALNENSEPQPDCAIFSGSPSDYRKTLSKKPVLVMELSDSTLNFDRTVKARLYASADIPEYWIVNLAEHQIEVFRDPQDEAGYKTTTISKKGGVLRPIGAPDLAIEVDKFFS